MYRAFFGFREKPFNLTPDPKFLYLNASYREAFAVGGPAGNASAVALALTVKRCDAWNDEWSERIADALCDSPFAASFALTRKMP